MAYNKECVIVVLDVRTLADEKFKQKSIKCVAEFLKDKICSGKKDYVSFVLIGTEKTKNYVNSELMQDGYLHLTEYSHTQLPTWQLLTEFYKFVNEPASEQGDWVDGLLVAMQMLKNNEGPLKFKRRRILLFYDFNGMPCNYDAFDTLASNMVEDEIDLTVISHNILFEDNPETGEAKAIFCDGPKSESQLKNEQRALDLVSSCNAILCNFTEALRCILKVENRCPWTWNCLLTIGSKIKIHISGMIAIKNESNIKLKKCWAGPDEQVSRELKLYVHGQDTPAEEIDQVSGYMLGATPIAYDESLEEMPCQYNPGLTFLSFTKRNGLPDEYFCGDSMYTIVHQKGKTASARKLDALVKVLLKTDMVMLCWKVYSAKFNNPKIVVLIPNKLKSDRPATLTMIELSYHAQHHFWDFPTLSTQKTQCSAEQIDAIDELIDSMDLMIGDKAALKPRESRLKDHLPFDSLPHIYEQNIMDVLERKILCSASEDDKIFEDMLDDKNFVEVFWKVPEAVEERAKRAAKRVKQLFPLERSLQSLDKAKANAASAAANIANTLTFTQAGRQDLSQNALLDFDRVRLESPAEDYERLIRHNILPLTSKTLRDTKLQTYAQQMQSIVLNLLRDSTPLAVEKIVSALKTYRKTCCQFNAIDDFNRWIGEVRSLVMERKLYDFWREHIKVPQLGYIIVGEISLDEAVKLQEFYDIELLAETQPLTMDDHSVDQLLASMMGK